MFHYQGGKKIWFQRKIFDMFVITNTLVTVVMLPAVYYKTPLIAPEHPSYNNDIIMSKILCWNNFFLLYS